MSPSHSRQTSLPHTKAILKRMSVDVVVNTTIDKATTYKQLQTWFAILPFNTAFVRFLVAPKRNTDLALSIIYHNYNKVKAKGFFVKTLFKSTFARLPLLLHDYSFCHYFDTL